MTICGRLLAWPSRHCLRNVYYPSQSVCDWSEFCAVRRLTVTVLYDRLPGLWSPHFFFFLWHNGLIRARVSSSMRFLNHTQRRITVGRNPLDEWSARRRDLYLTTHNTHNRKTSMPPVGFEPTISAGERPQIYALDRTATGTGFFLLCWPAMYSYALCTGICKKKIMSCHVWNYTVLMRLWNL